MPYVRVVKTASGATAVQIVHSSQRGSQDIEHIGSAHDDAELELPKAVAPAAAGRRRPRHHRRRPLPDDLRPAIEAINHASRPAH